jgi:hypothetical protein
MAVRHIYIYIYASCICKTIQLLKSITVITKYKKSSSWLKKRSYYGGYSTIDWDKHDLEQFDYRLKKVNGS